MTEKQWGVSYVASGKERRKAILKRDRFQRRRRNRKSEETGDKVDADGVKDKKGAEKG